MPADPMPTDAYRQEFFQGHAEDQAWIVQNGAKVDVAYGKLDRAVRSFEWTRLEPGVVSGKFYAPGLGIVREVGRGGWDRALRARGGPIGLIVATLPSPTHRYARWRLGWAVAVAVPSRPCDGTAAPSRCGDAGPHGFV